MLVTINHTANLDLEHIVAVARDNARVELAPETRDMLTLRRTQIERRIHEDDLPAYGFNRGFGHNVDLSVKPELLSELQENLIKSHAVGVGEAADKATVRAAMLLRANSLARGFSGVRPELVEHLISLLNAGVTPVVPQLGSVGASGDLAPLSHIALVLIGLGRAEFQGKVMDGATALQQAGMEPIRLEMKEGLALNNGVQFMTSIGLLACHALKDLLRTAAINSALVAQVMLAPDTYYRPDFHAVRPHPGAQRVADWIWRLMQNSPIREAHRDVKTDGQLQDPYNIRCAAQVLGSCHDLISQAETALIIEANSATDNPILLPDANGECIDVVSGGHFHGMPVAVQVYNLYQALSIMTTLAHQRSARFVDPFRNKGLGRDLKWPGMNADDASISSGMMMLEYTSASLVNDIWGHATPSHLFNIPTNSGQEDHVSMGTTLAVRLARALPKAAHVLAIELAYILQAVAIRKSLNTIPTEAELPEWVTHELDQLKQRMNGEGRGMVFSASVVREHPVSDSDKLLSPVSEHLFADLTRRKIFPTVTRDRCMADQITALAALVETGEIPSLANATVPLFW